jgi:hypothetical protein
MLEVVWQIPAEWPDVKACVSDGYATMGSKRDGACRWVRESSHEYARIARRIANFDEVDDFSLL